MRRLLLLFGSVLLALSTACGIGAPPPVPPTPTSLKPALLQTPRPTLPATSTPLPASTAVADAGLVTNQHLVWSEWVPERYLAP